MHPFRARAYDCGVPRDLTPFPRPGEHFLADPRGSALPPAPAILSKLTIRDRVLLATWNGAVFVVVLSFTLALTRHAVGSDSHNVSAHYLVAWVTTGAASLALLAVVGGLVVFRRDAPWSAVLLWPLLSGVAVGAGCVFGLSGQIDGGSALCDAPAGSSCDTAWGLGAWVLGIASAVVLTGLFAASFAARRLVATLRQSFTQ
jgi:hypothetical protein